MVITTGRERYSEKIMKNISANIYASSHRTRIVRSLSHQIFTVNMPSENFNSSANGKI